MRISIGAILLLGAWISANANPVQQDDPPGALSPESFGIIMAEGPPVVMAINCHTPPVRFPLVVSGDRFLEVDGKAIATTADFRKALRSAPRGRPIKVVVESGMATTLTGRSHRRTLSVTLPDAVPKAGKG